MLPANKKTSFLLICLAMLTLASGCTDWKKKYGALYVEHENLKGLLDREQSEKGQLTDQLSKNQQTIDELQKKIAERHQTAAQATGFGEGYDVAFDPRAGTITVTLPNTILFDPGKATLKKTTITELDHIQSVLRSQYSGRLIDVVGHTDADPIRRSKWKDNWELSAERSLAVVRYLIEKGLPKEGIRAVGRGETHPVASNAAASGKTKNRRVEIVVYMR
jgi:chemotaxis protein MotB